MINTFEIENFKCLTAEKFDFGKLNIITGLNSSGKSSVIQALLLFADAANAGDNVLKYYSFDVIKNRYQNVKELTITLNGTSCKFEPGRFNFSKHFSGLKKDETLFYLNENRIGPEDTARHTETDDTGEKAEYLLSYLYKHKSDQIDKGLIKAESKTLSQNVDYWLQQIFNKDVELKVEKTTDPKTLGVVFNFDELEGILPTQLGAGLSYATEVIVMCLRAKPGQTVIIENPEIHLHPAAQSKMGEFLAFVASAGVQLIVETHCEHLINRVRYEVFSEKLSANDVKIFYKEDCRSPFFKMSVSEDGHYMRNEEPCDFPSGFFDATLDQLIEIG